MALLWSYKDMWLTTVIYVPMFYLCMWFKFHNKCSINLWVWSMYTSVKYVSITGHVSQKSATAYDDICSASGYGVACRKVPIVTTFCVSAMPPFWWSWRVTTARRACCTCPVTTLGFSRGTRRSWSLACWSTSPTRLPTTRVCSFSIDRAPVQVCYSRDCVTLLS